MIHVLAATLLVRALNLIGTFVFALSGAVLGARREMDLFGVLVLAFVTAVSGGIMRDVLIGAIPPEAFSSWHTLVIALIAGLLGFVFYDRLETLRNPVQIFDAAGLGVFAVAGTQKALEYGLNLPMAAILGMVSGIGGGMARDVLTAQVPIVLRTDIYALAALAASLVVVAGYAVGMPPTVTALVGIVLCLFLRLMALYGGWHLPAARRKR